LSEYLAGTNPTNSSSLLQLQNIQPAGNGSMALNWQSVAHKYYTLETSTNLVNWMPIAQNLPATSPLNQYTNFASVPGTSFYRVSVAPY